MKANELKIKNIVLDEYLEPVFIVAILPHKLIASQSGDWDEYCKYLTYSDVEPIPLTEEWLCKTEAQLQPWGWVLNGILIRTNHKEKFWIELGNGKRIELPYVHSLQNFFTLANEELTFKL